MSCVCCKDSKCSTRLNAPWSTEILVSSQLELFFFSRGGDFLALVVFARFAGSSSFFTGRDTYITIVERLRLRAGAGGGAGIGVGDGAGGSGRFFFTSFCN